MTLDEVARKLEGLTITRAVWRDEDWSWYKSQDRGWCGTGVDGDLELHLSDGTVLRVGYEALSLFCGGKKAAETGAPKSKALAAAHRAKERLAAQTALRHEELDEELRALPEESA